MRDKDIVSAFFSLAIETSKNKTKLNKQTKKKNNDQKKVGKIN
jgi:hypothetical protein